MGEFGTFHLLSSCLEHLCEDLLVREGIILPSLLALPRGLLFLLLG